MSLDLFFEKKEENKEVESIAVVETTTANGALRKDDIVELSDTEHVLHRPTIYIGSVVEESIPTYVYEQGRIVQKPLLQIPGLCKIIDEIIDNSVDEAIRTGFKFGNKIKVDFDTATGTVTVEDNGRGLPIEQREDGKWTPEVIFTKLRAGSNFNDDGRATIGMNGVGSSLAALMSSSFEVDTANSHLRYKQKIEFGFSKIHAPKMEKSSRNYTKVTFTPSFEYFKASEETKKNLAVMIDRRLKNLSFAFPEIRFTYNGQQLAGSSIKQFMSQIHEIFEFSESPIARLGVFFSDTDFQQMSFVNGVETKRGGTHVDHVTWKITEAIREQIKKKHKLEVKPADIRSKLFVMLSIRIENAQFDGQTKERLMNPAADFKTAVDSVLTEKLLAAVSKNPEILDPIVEAYKLQQQVKDNLELKKLAKGQKKIKVDKYLQATEDTKYLLLCEGDSAQSGLMAALGRSTYSYFALRGKPLNTHEVKPAKILENEEIKNVVNILNLDLTHDAQVGLTHEKVVFATDSDLDGVHIKGLLLTLFNRFTPSMIKNTQICHLQTPIVTGKKKGKIVKWFFELSDYSDFSQTEEAKQFEWTYYKGLGSWSVDDNELAEVVKLIGIDNMIRPFVWSDDVKEKIDDWFAGAKVEARKNKVRGRSFNIDGV